MLRHMQKVSRPEVLRFSGRRVPEIHHGSTSKFGRQSRNVLSLFPAKVSLLRVARRVERWMIELLNLFVPRLVESQAL